MINSYSLLLIDHHTLCYTSFDKVFDEVLQPILKETKKTIYIISDLVYKMKYSKNKKVKDRYNEVYQKYFRAQDRLRITNDYKNMDEALSKHPADSILVFVAAREMGQCVAKFKHRAIFFQKHGFSIFRPINEQVYRDRITNVSKDKITLKGHLPKKGDYVFYKENGNKETLQLTKVLASGDTGGEGIVYETNSRYVAKIYKQDGDKINASAYTEQKLRLLTKVKLSPDTMRYICLPISNLYNSNQELVGFLMEKASGFPVQYILTPKDRKRYFPNCGTAELIQMCMRFLELVIELHKHDVKIGDINTNNILCDTNCNVYLIDCDSYQIGNFPCPVASPDFLHPAHWGKHMSGFMRNFADEYYAVAIFLFMLINPGFDPYVFKDGVDRKVAAKEGRFPYDKNGQSPKAPIGGERYWNRLSYELKEAFCHTFQKGGRHYKIDKLLKPEDWYMFFRNFQQTVGVHSLDANKGMNGFKSIFGMFF